MAVKQESLNRLRDVGRSNGGTERAAGEAAAFDQGRSEMLACVVSSKAILTSTAVRECERKLRK